MKNFTTNWYLYKTHFGVNSTQSKNGLAQNNVSFGNTKEI